MTPEELAAIRLRRRLSTNHVRTDPGYWSLADRRFFESAQDDVDALLAYVDLLRDREDQLLCDYESLRKELAEAATGGRE